jgi:hypothetical protein
MTEPGVVTLRDLLWARELDIYEARGKGDLGRYEAEITASYLAWPPQHAAPIDAAAFGRDVRKFAGSGAELLTMTLTGFSADGDTAILYYATHRTRLPDGQPADEHFEVVHVWLRREGDWRLFGGMARAAPARPEGGIYPRGE